jgi:hypothetical protein
VKKKASRKIKPSPEKLLYEKSEAESIAAVKKDVDAFWKGVAEKCELRRNPPKLMFLPAQELRKKSMNARKNSVSDISPRHYRTMMALSTSHIRRHKK